MRRKIRTGALALALVLFLAAMPFGAMATGLSGYAYVVNTSKLNLRSGPSTAYPVIGSAARSEMVQVFGPAASGNWYSVSLLPSGPVGFMSGNFLGATPQMTSPEPLPALPAVNPVPTYGSDLRAVVKNPNPNSYLNLREYPSYTAKVLGIYYNGTLMTVLSESNGWYNVRMDSGLRGYFRYEFVSFDLSTAPPPPTGGVIGSAKVTSSGGRVNLRQGPGYSYPVLASYYPGKIVQVYTNDNAFWQISVDGLMGYMDRSFLTAVSGGGGTGSTNARVRSGANLNLRAEPGTFAKILGNYPGGTAVDVRRQGLEWCYVTLPSTGATGYFMTRYLSLSGLPEIPTRIVKNASGGYVNLRGRASLSGTVITRVPHNSVVTILAPMGSWTKVKFGATTGYMMSSFLQ